MGRDNHGRKVHRIRKENLENKFFLRNSHIVLPKLNLLILKRGAFHHRRHRRPNYQSWNVLIRQDLQRKEQIEIANQVVEVQTKEVFLSERMSNQSPVFHLNAEFFVAIKQ